MQLIQGDCNQVLESVDDNSINLIVTSPPYYLDKEYEKSTTYAQYTSMMETSFLNWARVLIPGGYAVVNFGDYFNSGNRFYKAEVPSCYPASINYFNWGTINAGLDLQATRIWRKQFSRMGIPFVCNTHPRPVFDYEHVWTFRKKSGYNKEVVVDRKLTQRGVIGDGWNSSAGLKIHCAAFPIELPTWAIQVYSSPGDLVLDPFMGSGTTGLACKNLARDFLGIELNPTYFSIASERLQ